jgi:3-oxoacyl-[acyl-carrier protein] reductase
MSAIYSDLENKKVLITGATRGIGRSIALELAKQKAHIIFNYRTPSEQVETLISEIKMLGGQATSLEFDVTDYVKMTKSIDDFIKSQGEISGLVNNAGISKDQLALRIKPTDIDDVLNVNLKSTMVLTHHMLKYLMKIKGASIIHMSSVVGLMGNTAQSVYAASKAGLIGHAKSIAKEYGSRDLRINVICPGFIQTEMTDKLSEETRNHYLKAVPLNRFGQTQDVAQLVNFLLSNASGYITGEVIKIDGGLYI